MVPGTSFVMLNLEEDVRPDSRSIEAASSRPTECDEPRPPCLCVPSTRKGSRQLPAGLCLSNKVMGGREGGPALEGNRLN